MVEIKERETVNTYFTQFKKYLNHICVISDSSWKSIESILSMRSYKEDEYLLKPGEIEKNLRFISRGFVKVSFIGKNDSYIYDFCGNNKIMVDNISYFEKTPTYFEMQTITPCDILIIDGQEFLRLIKTNEEINKLTLKVVNDYMKENQKKQSLFHMQSAQERYLDFCETKQEILQSVKLADLASYLGITQQSLSRIRKTVIKNE